jgi:putative ABC transport system permease protein
MWARLRHHGRMHILLALAWAVTTAVLLGSLLVGPSVKNVLRQRSQLQIGQVRSCLIGAGRSFSDNLALRLSEAGGGQVAPALIVSGSASSDQAGLARAQIIGCDERFWSLAPESAAPAAGLVLNRLAADRLQVVVGDELVLRLPVQRWMPMDAPLAPEDGRIASLRQAVTAIVDAPEFGNFDLRGQQTPVANIFLPLARVQELSGEGGAPANALLADLPASHLRDVLTESWQPEDCGLQLLPRHAGTSLESERIFLDPGVSVLLQHGGEGVFSYLVTEVTAGERSTPYSIVAGLEAAAFPANGPQPPADWSADGLLINQWLADDLQVQTGDAIELHYLLPGAGNTLQQSSYAMQVAGVLPMQGIAIDAELMPPFPGLAGKQDCADWDPGMVIDMDAIRDKDEEYWDTYQGAPKAFLPLATAQELWHNRFGNLTAIRFPERDPEAVRASLRHLVEPADLGLVVRDLEAELRQSVTQGMDFGGMLLAMNMVLVASGIALLSLLLQLATLQRRREVGTLLGMGFLPSRVRRQLLAEYLLSALPGLLVGIVIAWWYAGQLSGLLHRIWVEQVLTEAIPVVLAPGTVLVGLLSTLIIGGIVVWRALGRLVRQPIPLLLHGQAQPLRPHPAAALLLTLLALLALVGGMVLSFSTADDIRPLAFFGGGFLLLIGLCACLAAWLLRRPGGAGSRGFGALARAGLRRRPGRALTVVILLAMGTFLVVAVGSQYRHQVFDVRAKQTPSGGYALIADVAIPLRHDPGTVSGRESLQILEADWPAGIDILPLRISQGTDADCTNLQRAQRPSLVGVDPDKLVGRFRFSGQLTGMEQSGWQLLTAKFADGAVPAILDEATLMWALGAGLGGELLYEDEFGQPLRLRPVAQLGDCILQGSVLIPAAVLRERFPSAAGFPRLLIDVPAEAETALREELRLALGDHGLEVRSSRAYLAALHRIQNGYIAIFQLLGAAGLVVAGLGLGLVVYRGVWERRGELAALYAMGHAPARIRWWLVSEYGPLLLFGAGIGAISACWAAWPGVTSELPVAASGPLLLVLAIALVCGIGSLLWASVAVLRYVDVRALAE